MTTCCVILWVEEVQPTHPKRVLSIQLCVREENGESRVVAALSPGGFEITFRLTGEQESPAYPGFKLYGIGRFKVETFHEEEAGSGWCYAFAMESKTVARLFWQVLNMGWEFSSEDQVAVIHAMRCSDPVDIDDVGAFTAEDVERLVS